MIGALSDENCWGLTPKPLRRRVSQARHHREDPTKTGVEGRRTGGEMGRRRGGGGGRRGRKRRGGERKESRRGGRGREVTGRKREGRWKGVVKKHEEKGSRWGGRKEKGGGGKTKRRRTVRYCMSPIISPPCNEPSQIN